MTSSTATVTATVVVDADIQGPTISRHLYGLFATIEAGTRDAAEQAMYAHIIDAWQRRRLPDHSGKRAR